MLTQEEIKELVGYNPITGQFTSKQKLGSRSKVVGEIIGTRISRGTSVYLQVSLKKQRFYLHRLAWFYMTGEQANVLDHIDGNGLNNKWENLRNGTQKDNNRNILLIQHNKIDQLPLGVFKHRNKFTAAIKYNYKKIHLGVFTTIAEASQAYQDAKVLYHVR